jgi:hypothetical protein
MKYHTKLNGPFLILESTMHILITHIILQCPQIYHHYKDDILIRLSHHNHFTHQGKYGASNKLLLCLTFSQAKYLGLAKPKRAHDMCIICIKLPL